MKNKILTLISLLLLAGTTLSGQSAPKNLNPVGDWNYLAPDAPEGYQSGTFSVTSANNAYSVTFGVAGSDYRIPGEKVKFENNVMTFYVLLDGTQIDFNLKIESEKKMTGKASYFEGEVPLTLTKAEKK
ncbi:MAG: hypothetical protein MUD02_06910 [Bacteroidales bacterium]|jgi:hypothetical protein|nr:hypothetical protein [Bacteroidales bacterium]MCU0408661.1 hypothetical protein [Bacteroidales bacterium]